MTSPPPPAWGRVDFLKLTVWGETDPILSRLEAGILEREYSGEFEAWEEAGRGGRVSCVLRAVPGLSVLEYGPEAEYRTVELKGEVCERIGNEGVAALLWDLRGMGVRASRVDAAWDGVPFSVADVRRAAAAGDVRTRLKLPEVPGYVESETGETVYVGRRTAERFVRVYTKPAERTGTRFEVEFKGEVAAVIVSELSGLEPAEWPARLLAHARGTVDFVDRGADERADRCPLLAWWAAFVEGGERRTVTRQKPSETGTVLGRLDEMLKRNARQLEAARRAFGDAWLLDRIHWWAMQRWEEADNQRVSQLRKYRGTGLCRVPEREDGGDIPI